jgi:hypothetical protein
MNTSTSFSSARGMRSESVTAAYFAADPLGFEAGDANLYRYVGNDPTNATDPTGLKPDAKDPTDAFRDAAKKNGMSDKEIDLILKVAKETLSESTLGLGNHQICFEWVVQFEKNLNAELIKLRPKDAKGPAALLSGINYRGIKILSVPYNAQGNTPRDIKFRSKILPTFVDMMCTTGIFPSTAGSRWLLSQEHTVYKITLGDGSSWYIDMGTISGILGRKGNINNLTGGKTFVTPANGLPNKWSETDKVGVSRHETND